MFNPRQKFHLRCATAGGALLVLLFHTSLWWCSDSVYADGFRNKTEASPVGPSMYQAPTLSVVGQSVTRKLAGGVTETAFISVSAAQFFTVCLEQRGAILVATLSTPSGQEIVQFDSAAGPHGPIYFSAIASESGNYQVSITSREKWANPANYELTIQTLRPSQPGDQELIEAERSFAEGRKLFRSGKITEALTSYEKSLRYWNEKNDGHWQAVTMYAQSEAYRLSTDRTKLEPTLRKTLEILNAQMAANDWRLKASTLNDLGALYATRSDPQQALEPLNVALGLFSSHGDRRGQASSLNNLARVQDRLGNLTLARELLLRASQFRKEENDQGGVANLLSALGVVADRLGEPDAALNYFHDALAAWQKVQELRPSDNARIAAVFNNLAAASEKLGQFNQALTYYDEALSRYAVGDPNRAATLDNKGDLFASLGDPTRAADYYNEALAILEKTGSDVVDFKAGVLIHMGQLAMNHGDIAGALNRFHAAKNLKPARRREADTLVNIGAALTLKGDLSEALEYFRKALEIQSKLADVRGQAITHQKRGETYAQLNNSKEALTDFQNARRLWKSLKDLPGESLVLNNIAKLYSDQGNVKEGLTTSDEAIAVIESLRTRVSSYQLRTLYFAQQANYFDLNIDLKMRLGGSDSNRAYIGSALEASERARARVLLDTLNEVVLARGQVNNSGAAKQNEVLAEITSLHQSLRSKAQARSTLLNGPHLTSQIAAIDREIDSIGRKLEDLDSRLRSQSSRLAFTQPRPATLSEIQRQIDSESLLLEYALGEKRSYVFAVTNDSIKGLQLESRDKIEAVANRLVQALTARNRQEPNETPQQRNAREDKADKDYADAAQQLSKMVIEPVASLLGQKRLVIVADGALQYVPFAALPISEPTPQGTNSQTAISATNQPTTLITNHELVSLPSASVLALQRREFANRKPAPLKLAVLADPVFDLQDPRVATALAKPNRNRKGSDASASNAPTPAQNTTPKTDNSTLVSALRDVGLNPDGTLRRLSMSRTEASDIARLVSPKQSLKALDFRASRETAKSRELSKYQYVHFATHGILSLEHPELSGIALSMVDEKGEKQDGYLRLYEIYNLDLPAELVVLSACETGVGKQVRGEGLIALTRGFMYAGAKRVVASLWKVDDSATATLMAQFYKEMFVSGRSPAAALKEAQNYMAKQRRWRSPYYWAGFVLQGEWR